MQIKIYFRKFLRTIKFLIVQRIYGFKIDCKPSFRTKEEIEWFRESIKNCNFYLEFGSGGTTFIAAQERKKIISIESDQFFQRSLIKKMKKKGVYDVNKQKFTFKNIGLTKEWGYPIFKKHSSQYSEIKSLINDNNYPDFILIDGRYRVACAIKILILYENVKNKVILAIDDYRPRDHYHILEKYLSEKQLIGDIAIFDLNVVKNLEELISLLSIYENDPR
jgi:hypothetical protein